MRQQPFLEVTSTQDLALAEGDVAKGRASGATLDPTEGCEVTLIKKVPALHLLDTQQYTCTTRNQLVVASVGSGESNCFTYK